MWRRLYLEPCHRRDRGFPCPVPGYAHYIIYSQPPIEILAGGFETGSQAPDLGKRFGSACAELNWQIPCLLICFDRPSHATVVRRGPGNRPVSPANVTILHIIHLSKPGRHVYRSNLTRIKNACVLGKRKTQCNPKQVSEHMRAGKPSTQLAGAKQHICEPAHANKFEVACLASLHRAGKPSACRNIGSRNCIKIHVNVVLMLQRTKENTFRKKYVFYL